MNNKTTVTSHGKVILIGEHSVVYGKNAFAMPIKALNIRTSIEQTSYANTQMITNNYQGDFLEAPTAYNGLKYIYQTLTSSLDPTPSLQITYEGEIPIERGLGSSAVVALGTTKALNDFFHLDLTEKQIMKIANHAEMINHGKASGLDTATVNSNYLVSFNKSDGPTALKAHLGASLLIMDSGQLGNTKQAVKLVQQQYKTTSDGKERIDQLGTLADEFKSAWLTKDTAKIGEIFQLLSTEKPKENLVIQCPETLSSSDNLSVRATLYNASFEKIDNADIHFVLHEEDSGREYDFLFAPDGDAYRLDAGTLPEGDYTYTASTDFAAIF